MFTVVVGTVAGLTACSLFVVYDVFGQNMMLDPDQQRTLLERDAIVSILVLLVSVLLAMYSSRRFASIISAPLEQLSAATSRVTEKQDYSVRLQEAGQDELARLAASFNQMMEAIQSRDSDLRSANEMFDSFVNHSPTLVSIKDVDLRYEFVNFSGRRWMNKQKNEILGKTDRELWEPAVAEKLEALDRQALSGQTNLSQGESVIFDGHSSTMEFPFPEGSRMLSMVRFVLRDGKGKPHLGCMAVDETDRLRAERALRASEERYALAVEGSSDGIWDWDLGTGKVYFSQRCREILALENPQELEDLYLAIYPPDKGVLRRALDRLVEGQDDTLQVEFRLGKSGERWVQSRATGMRGEDGRATRVAGFLSDITARKQHEEQLRYEAFHDALTGLPNRALYIDRVTLALDRLKRTPEALFAVAFMDLDGFKAINDTLGHAVGDALLVEVATRLKKVTRAEDTVARVGGDEFVLLLEELTQPADVIRIAERVLAALRKPIEVGRHSLRTAGSIGIALSNRGYDRAEVMMSDADNAMYTAKRSGKATYRIFDSDMHEAAVARLKLEAELREAVEREEFVLHYQPIFELKTGRVAAFEALARWQHPKEGLLMPSRFLAAAEDCGLLNQMSPFLIKRALKDLTLLVAGDKNVQVSINLSVRQFQHPALVDNLTTWLRDTGVEASAVRLEVTERALARDPEGARMTLQRLRELGFFLTLDDFGSGSSSLDNLRAFPFTALKVDYKLVSGMQEGDANTSLVLGMIHFSRGLNCQCVAEGVEKEHQLQVLQEAGCDLAQGFRWSPAVSLDEALKILQGSPQLFLSGPVG